MVLSNRKNLPNIFRTTKEIGVDSVDMNIIVKNGGKLDKNNKGRNQLNK